MRQLILALWTSEGQGKVLGVNEELLQHDCQWQWCDEGGYAYGSVTLAETMTKEVLLRLLLPWVREQGCVVYLGEVSMGTQVRYALCDLDGTILRGELLSLLAQGMPYEELMRSEVERAMSGSIDFATSFRRRTALLDGLGLDRLREVFGQVGWAEGLSNLLSLWRAKEIRYELATSNYHVFAEWAALTYGFSHYIATTLELQDERLTGQLIEPIVDAQGKADFLLHRLDIYDLTYSEALVIGDGANDLKMLAEAGHSLIYCAAPSCGRVQSICEIYERLEQLWAARMNVG